MRKKIQEHTFNDPVSTPYGKANSSLRPDSFLKPLVILKIFALAALVQKFVRMTSDFKKLFTGPGKNYIFLRKYNLHNFTQCANAACSHQYSSKLHTCRYIARYFRPSQKETRTNQSKPDRTR